MSDAKPTKGRGRFVSLVVAVVGAAIVWALFRFNQSATSYNQYLVGNLIGLFWVPMLTILFIFGEEPSKFGFSPGSSRRIWTITAVVFAALLVPLFIASRWQVFQSAYPWFRHFPEFWPAFRDYPRQNPFISQPSLMLFGLLSYGMYLFCWEFFFRGYLLLGLARSIGWSAIIVQALAFGLLHYGKPKTEMIASFAAGIALGTIALSAKSFVPCFVLHWAASIGFDILVVATRSQ